MVLALLLNRAYKKAITGRLNGSTPEIAVPAGGRTEHAFTMAMFALMGRVSKLNGHVSAGEVRYASTIMNLLGLNSEGRLEAISFFEQGKQLNTDVMQCVHLMVKVIGPRSALSNLFLKIQCRNSYVKGDMRLEEKVLLRDVAEALGFSKTEFLAICAEMQRHVDSKQVKAKSFLHSAYTVLQLEPEVADGEIRRAYLRLMSRYHPDKLVRDDLSEESLKQAQEKSMAIRSAYEMVCGFRKIRA